LISDLAHLNDINEQNKRRIDALHEEKLLLERERHDQTQRMIEQDEKIQELELNIEQNQESNTKLRKALQTMKNKEQVDHPDTCRSTSVDIINHVRLRSLVRLGNLTEEYEQRLKDQTNNFHDKLKAMAKEMNAQIEEKDRQHQRQLREMMGKRTIVEGRLALNILPLEKQPNDQMEQFERRLYEADERATLAEEQMLRMEEQLKVTWQQTLHRSTHSIQEKQLEHHRCIIQLQEKIEQLTKNPIV
jgi:hypothetical protein